MLHERNKTFRSAERQAEARRAPCPLLDLGDIGDTIDARESAGFFLFSYRVKEPVAGVADGGRVGKIGFSKKYTVPIGRQIPARRG